MMRINYSENIILSWVAEIIYFPVWWYSFGLLKIISFVQKSLIQQEKKVGMLVWLRNIFVPMYGQRDLVSRLVSFIVRLFQVFVRGVVMLFFTALALIFIIIWVTLPVVVFFGIYNNLLDANIT